MLITESLYNLLYNLPSAPPEMGGLLGQSKNTINTFFVDSGKISFRKSCQYVPNELLLNQTISDWDAQGIIFKGIFHTHKEGHGCQCLSSADIVYIRSIMNAYVKKLYFPIVIPHTGVFPYLAVYDQLSGLSITPEVWGDRIFEKCGIRRDEEGDGGKTLEIRGKRRLSARDGGANYQQS